jgi:hypothetical protein
LNQMGIIYRMCQPALNIPAQFPFSTENTEYSGWIKI